MVIAIDGPAGSGKSTVAHGVAARLGYTYVDTGAMYRAVALLALRRGVDLKNAAALEEVARQADLRFDGQRLLAAGEDVAEAIRAPEVAQAASLVSTAPGVRREMVAQQRRLGQSGSVVMEGRDIGTVVFPEAAVKFFLDASPEARVSRRFQEKPEGHSLEQVAAEIRERDARDRGREHSPLRCAPDAIYLDTTDLTAEEVVEKIVVTSESVRDRGSGNL